MSGATTRGARRPFDESGGKKKSSLFGKFNTRVQDAIEEGRGEEAMRQAVTETPKAPVLPADDVAIRRGQTPSSEQMIVPEGVVIEGTMTSASETQIAGRIEGDVTVEARLSLEPAKYHRDDLPGGIRDRRPTRQLLHDWVNGLAVFLWAGPGPSNPG